MIKQLGKTMKRYKNFEKTINKLMMRSCTQKSAFID